MADITKTISQFIESQFPEHYRENTDDNTYSRAVLIDFVEAYYEFVEANSEEHFLSNREILNYIDVDNTLTRFIDYFKKTYLREMPYVYAVDDEFAIKHIIDLYRAKGTEASLKLLIRLIFNQDISVYYPGQDVLRASHSVWVDPRYLELSHSHRTKDFIGKRVRGSSSGSTAYAQSLVTKSVNGKYIDILYITDIRGGNFVTGEYISDDGAISRAPKLIGSLSSVEVVKSGSGYSVGDRLTIESDEGTSAKARITEVLDPTNIVEFELVDGGYGYSLTDSSVYVSTAILFVENPNKDYTIFETVRQPLSQITTNNSIDAAVGDVVTGLDATSNTVASGVIVSINDDKDQFVIEERSGTFEKQYTLTLQTDNKFIVGEVVEEGDSVELEVSSLSGPFTPGERVMQRDLVNGVYQNVAYGDFVSQAINTVVLENVFGEFLANNNIEGVTSGTTADIENVTKTFEGQSGEIISAAANTITITPNGSPLTSNNSIRGAISYNINVIDNITESGLTSISISGNTEYVDAYSNVTASGFVLGQDEEKVGLYGNTNPFYFAQGVENILVGDSFDREITRIGKGFGANFDLNTLNPDTIETGNIVSDLISGENIVDIEYLDLFVGANNSGINKLSANVAIADGGTGYANNTTIVFSGGGYDGGDPLISAKGTVQVDGSGVITGVTVSDPGQGYYTIPDYAIAGGANANLVFSVESGYGFSKDPTIGLDGIINDALGERSITIGEISSIKNVNSGEQYDTGVFVRVINEEIQEFIVEDIVLSVANLAGTFAIGEVIEGGTSGAKGRVRELDFDVNTVSIKNLSFFNNFQIGETLTGANSQSTAVITQVNGDSTRQLLMGENAEFSSQVIFAEGVVSQIEITDSGYGYVDGRQVRLINANNALVTTGTGRVSRQGVGTGFWKGTAAHLNDKFLHDNKFYQEYSYQVISSLSFEQYENIVRDLVHVAGTELYGKVEVQTDPHVMYDLSSSIVLGNKIIASGVFIADNNVADVSFLNIELDGQQSGVGRFKYAVTIANSGFGYSNSAVIEITGGGPDANTEPTVPAQASIITDDDGRIVDFSVNIEGEGYYSVPEVTIPGGDGNANVIVEIEFGYGFIRDPYSNINNIIGDTIGGGQVLFDDTEVVFDD